MAVPSSFEEFRDLLIDLDRLEERALAVLTSVRQERKEALAQWGGAPPKPEPTPQISPTRQRPSRFHNRLSAREKLH